MLLLLLRVSRTHLYSSGKAEVAYALLLAEQVFGTQVYHVVPLGRVVQRWLVVVLSDHEPIAVKS